MKTVVLLFILIFAAHAFPQGPASPRPEPELISAPSYEPPPEALAAGIDGTILVYTAINEKGEVTEARAIAGPQWPCGTEPEKLLAEVRKGAAAAVRQAKFKPAMKDGKPIDSVTGLRVWLGQAFEAMQRKRAAEGQAEARRINGGIINGKAKMLAKPAYPMNARAERLSGTVTVGILIDEAGQVVSAGAENGHPYLQVPSREAACASKFSPTFLEGKPVKVSGVLVYNFIAP